LAHVKYKQRNKTIKLKCASERERKGCITSANIRLKILQSNNAAEEQTSEYQ